MFHVAQVLKICKLNVSFFLFFPSFLFLEVFEVNKHLTLATKQKNKKKKKNTCKIKDCKTQYTGFNYV